MWWSDRGCRIGFADPTRAGGFAPRTPHMRLAPAAVPTESRDMNIAGKMTQGRISRRGALALLTALPACGFTPAYGPGGAAQGLWGAISVDAPADEDGYVLVRRLEERLGRASAPRYRLAIDIRLTEEGLGVTPDQEITRYRLRGQLDFRLLELGGEAELASGELRSFTSYSAPVFSATRGSIAGNPVSVLTAERDAHGRLMVSLADRLVDRLIATAPDWR